MPRQRPLQEKLDIPYDPIVWNGDSDFNVELKYDVDRMNYMYHCDGTVGSDGTAVSWFSGLLPSLYSKSCIAVAHGFVDDDDERVSSPSVKSLYSTMEIPSSPLPNNNNNNNNNSSSLSTPSLRYTNTTIPSLPLPSNYPETSSSSNSGIGAGTSIVLLKSLRLYDGYKLKVLPSSSFLKKLRLKLKEKFKGKKMKFYRLDSSSYERQQPAAGAGPESKSEPQSQPGPERRLPGFSSRENDVALYPDDLDPDPFAKQFGPYRVGLY